MILVTSMLGMAACYLVLGGCFFIIEDNAVRQKAESITSEIITSTQWNIHQT